MIFYSSQIKGQKIVYTISENDVIVATTLETRPLVSFFNPQILLEDNLSISFNIESQITL